MDIEAIIARMSLADKISLCTGADFWHTKKMQKYGIPAIKMSDGPHGLRSQEKDSDMLGINEARPATCFPAAVTAGATWDPSLYEEEGAAIGREALAAGVSVVLGPGCNIKRNPLCGRSFEYLSEDPYHAGHMAAAFIRGLQSTGVGASLKHFAANNQEFKRQNGNSILDERTLREVYLAPFEIAVKEAKPRTVMCSYNRICGTYASDNPWLLTEVLRKEWGFDGAVITDWGAMHDRIAAFRAGCDLNMPGGARYMERAVMHAVKQGTLDEAQIDTAVCRILRLIADTLPKGQATAFDEDAHHALALRIAISGAVLLKNEGAVLPLAEKDAVLIGYMAKHPRYQGTGSSHIRPTRLESLADAMPHLPVYPVGDALGNLTEQELLMAAEAAKEKKIAVLAVGLPENYESEAFDRAHMRLPEGHLRLIEAVASANENTVVVLFGGGVMELPFADKVKAILYMGLPGQAGGGAAAALLTGRANPSGKLTESWPLIYEDTPSYDTFGQKSTEYREGIFVGYRYYDTLGLAVRYPFGHGLSYTTFSYSDLWTDGARVTAKIKNTGTRDGDEVVEVYATPKEKGLPRPLRTLVGFVRISLAVGEEKTVSIPLSPRAFSAWDGEWKRIGGEYEISLGASSRDIRLSTTVTVEGERIPMPKALIGSFYDTLSGKPSRADWERLMGHPVLSEREPAKGEFTMDNTISEMMPYSAVMRLLYRVAKRLVTKNYGKEPDPSDPTYRMMLVSVVECPLHATVICGDGMMKEAWARALVHLANGKWGRALLALLRRY